MEGEERGDKLEDQPPAPLRGLRPVPQPVFLSIIKNKTPIAFNSFFYLHEGLNRAFGYVQVGGAQMGALAHGGGRVYEEK